VKIVLKYLCVNMYETIFSVDLGDSSKYSNENLKTEVENGSI